MKHCVFAFSYHAKFPRQQEVKEVKATKEVKEGTDPNQAKSQKLQVRKNVFKGRLNSQPLIQIQTTKSVTKKLTGFPSGLFPHAFNWKLPKKPAQNPSVSFYFSFFRYITSLLVPRALHRLSHGFIVAVNGVTCFPDNLKPKQCLKFPFNICLVQCVKIQVPLL